MERVPYYLGFTSTIWICNDRKFREIKVLGDGNCGLYSVNIMLMLNNQDPIISRHDLCNRIDNNLSTNNQIRFHLRQEVLSAIAEPFGTDKNWSDNNHLVTTLKRVKSDLELSERYFFDQQRLFQQICIAAGLEFRSSDTPNAADIMQAAQYLSDDIQKEHEALIRALITYAMNLQQQKKVVETLEDDVAKDFLSNVLSNNSTYIRYDGLCLISILYNIAIEMFVSTGPGSTVLDRRGFIINLPSPTAIAAVIWNGSMVGGHYNALKILDATPPSSPSSNHTPAPPAIASPATPGASNQRSRTSRHVTSFDQPSSAASRDKRKNAAKRNRNRMQQHRKSLSTDQVEAERAKAANRMRNVRASETLEVTSARQNKDKISHQDKIAQQSPYIEGKVLSAHVKDFEFSPRAAQLQFAADSGFDLIATPGESTEIRREEVLDYMRPINLDETTEIIRRWNEETNQVDKALKCCAVCGVLDLSFGKLDLIALTDLPLLRLSREEYLEYNAPDKEPYKAAWHVFADNEESEVAYWVNSQYVEMNPSTNSFEALVCSKCKTKLLPEQTAQAASLPKFSIAAGVHFGSPQHLGLPQLSLAERNLISLNVQHSHVAKLVAGQLGLKGHIISFEHSGAKDIALAFPRISLESTLSVIFVGVGAAADKQQMQTDTDARTRLIQQHFKVFRIDVDIVYRWLKFLKAVNPLYKNIEVIDQNIAEPQLSQILPNLFNDAECREGEEFANIERQAVEEPGGALNNGIERDLTSVFVGPPVETELADTVVLQTVQNVTGRNTKGSNKPFRVQEERDPLNEFTQNDLIFMGQFPDLFPFGRCIHAPGSLPASLVQHILFQGDRRFGQCADFIFLAFNQLQRHAAARGVAAKVKSGNNQLHEFTEMTNEDGFTERLEQAISNPNSTDSKKLTAQIKSLIRLTGGTVPWSDMERKQNISIYEGFLFKFGSPTIYGTINPSTPDSPYVLRLCNDDGDPPFSLPIPVPSLQERSNLVVKNPTIGAIFFKQLVENVFQLIFDMLPQWMSKRNAPIPRERKLSPFGRVIASAGCIEQQGRGQPHWHMLVWTDVQPRLIREFLDDEEVRKAIYSRMDSTQQCWVPERLDPDEALLEVRDKIAAGELCPLPNESEEEYTKRWVDLAYLVCVHKHASTCHKPPAGATACRMAFPQHCVDNPTDARELRIVTKQMIDSEGKPKNVKHVVQLMKLSEPSLTDAPDALCQAKDGRIITTIFFRPQPGAEQPEERSEDHFIPGAAYGLPDNIQIDPDDEEDGINGMVVAFNAVLLALLGCNINFANLGSEEETRAALFYILKYITKNPVKAANVLTAWRESNKEVRTTFVSIADNTGTNRRTAQHELTRIINKKTGVMEISDQMAALCLLGLPSMPKSHDTWLTYIWPAVDYLKSRAVASIQDSTPQYDGPSDFDITPPYSPASVIAAATEVTDNGFMNMNQEDLIEIDIDQEDLMEIDLDQEDLMEIDLDQDDLIEIENLDENQCFLDADDHESDLPYFGLNHEFGVDEDFRALNENRERDHAAMEEGIPIVVGEKIFGIHQHEHYQFRGDALASMSFYEYCGIVVISKKSSSDAEVDDVNDNVDADNLNTHGRGRPTNAKFLFDRNHPLYKTHEQRLRSKQRVPVLAGAPAPRHPGEQKESSAWRAKADLFATYMLALFYPWSVTDYRPDIALNYENLRIYADKLKESKDAVDQAKLFWMGNISRGLLVRQDALTAITRHRTRKAHKWSDSERVENEWVSRHALEVDTDVNDEGWRIFEALQNAAARNEGIRDNMPVPTMDDSMSKFSKELQELLSLDQPNVSPNISNGHLEHRHAETVVCTQDEAHLRKITKELEADLEITPPSPLPLPPSDFQSVVANDAISLIDESPHPRLNGEQNKLFVDIIAAVNIYLQTQKLGPIRNRLILGGPGTGKSTFSTFLHQRLSTLSSPIISMSAYTGIAASNIPEGRTTSSTFAIPVNRAQTMSAEKIMKAKDLFGKRQIVFIDEVSTLSAADLDMVDHRLRSWGKSNLPFGGFLVLLVGDFFQLPPVGGTSIYLHFFAAKETSVSRLLKTFDIVAFTQQYRSEDPGHTRFLNEYRNLHAGPKPFKPTMENHFTELSRNDVMTDPSWSTAPILVSTNKQRHVVNYLQLQNFAKSKGLPIVRWKYSLVRSITKENQSIASVYPTDEEQQRLIYSNFPFVWGYYVSEAPCILGKNVNPSKGIANGTPGKMHSLGFSSDVDEVDFQARYNATGPGEFVTLAEPPFSINVEISNLTTIPRDEETIVSSRWVIPIHTKTKAKQSIRVGAYKGTLAWSGFDVELRFGMTFHKAQGLTLDKCILDLNNRSKHVKLDPCMLHVGTTRIRKTSDCRILPMLPSRKVGGSRFSHLLKMQWSMEFCKMWVLCYNDNQTPSGLFDKLESNKKKRKRPNDSVEN